MVSKVAALFHMAAKIYVLVVMGQPISVKKKKSYSDEHPATYGAQQREREKERRRRERRKKNALDCRQQCNKDTNSIDWRQRTGVVQEEVTAEHTVTICDDTLPTVSSTVNKYV